MAKGPLLSTLGSYVTPDDGYRHVIVSTIGGELHEIFYKPPHNKGIDTLAHFCGVRLLTAFFTPDDHFQHPVVGTDSGDIFDVYYQPGSFHVTGSLANLPDMVALSGFYAADDGMRMLIAGQADGSIREIFYNPAVGVHLTQPALATFPGLTHLTAFYTGDDKYRHAIVATAKGDIFEVFYHRTIGVHISEPPLANFQNIIGLDAFYAEDDRTRIVIVATQDGGLHEIFYRSDIGVHVTQPVLTTIPNIVGISAFYTDDDKYRHVIVTDTAGTVTEVFYHPAIGVHVSRPPLAAFPDPAPAVEMVGPDLTNLSPAALAAVGGTSPAGRCVAIGGTPSRLYTLSHTGGVWFSADGEPWSLQPGSPAPASLFASFQLAVSPLSSAHAVAGNDGGLFETIDGGATWSFVLDATTLGATSARILAVAFDDADRLYVGVADGIVVRPASGSPFRHTPLAGGVSAIAVSDTKVWARTSVGMAHSTDQGTTWQTGSPIPASIQAHVQSKEVGSLAATDDYAFISASISPGETACGGDNALAIYSATADGWILQRVLSSDLAAWHQARGETPDPHTCNGTGGDDSLDGRHFVKTIRLRDTSLANVIGQRIQLIYGSGQEVWRARGQAADGTITDWNWVAGTQGPGYSNRDPVHADIWDVHLDPTPGGRTAWIAGDGGVYSATFTRADYEFAPGTEWQPAMAGLHTHQIQTLTLLRIGQVNRPRLVYAIGDSGSFYQNTSAVVLPEAPWDSFGWLGDGTWTGGDSSAPQFAQLVRNLTIEAFLRFGAPPFPVRMINPKTTSFVDPSIPTRFRYLAAPWQEGPFATADVVMMVDLPLTFEQNGIDVPFPTQPGPSSNGAPVLIRNHSYDANPDINTSKAVSWTLERSSLPAGTQGFAISGDRAHPVYYIFTSDTLFAERNDSWTQILTNLISSPTFGPVFPNPYDTNVVYALTSDKGVQVSSDAGSTFTPANNLNALLGGDAHAVNQIAFNYDHPPSTVVCTRSGQVFHGTDLDTWNDLTPLLPTPLIPINSAAIDCEAIYLGTFGRGLIRIVQYG